MTINERQALIDFYTATGGSNWIDHTNWLGPDGTECTWIGVVCSAGPPPNNVIQIGLNGNNLTGSLPNLDALTELQNLSLPNNHLWGPLPPLQNLAKLVGVNVRNNLLSGPFPNWNFFAPFVSIDLGNNAFSGPLPSIILTSTLISFKVDGNFFNGTLPILSSNLTNLQEFAADENQLIGSIPSLSSFTSLKTFTVSGNDLTGGIPAISALTSLQTFDVSNNHLTGLLPTVFPATLRRFHASNNSLSGSMPSLASTQLWTFRIDGNAQIVGAVSSGPSPNTLLPGLSALCPTGLNASNDSQTNAQWDAATGHMPWDSAGQCAQQPPNGSPDLRLKKSHAGNFSRGQTGAMYSLVVSNNGAVPTSGPVTVVDALPASLTVTALDGWGWTCSVANKSCTRSDPLASGASYTAITLTVNVASNAPASITNTANVSGGGETNTSNDAASDPTTIDNASAGPDLTLTKSHAGNFSRGQSGATYSFIVHNIGAAATSGTVTLQDALPGSLAATDIGGQGWACTPATKTCTRGDPLAAGASYPTITLFVDVAADAPPTVTNSANVSGGGEANPNNDFAIDPTMIDSTPVVSPEPDLMLAKSHAGDFSQGQTSATYSLLAYNAGAAPTNGMISVVDTLPSWLTPTNMGGPGWTCDLQTTSCSRSDPIDAGVAYPAITLTVDVATNAPSLVTNTALVSGGGESNTVNDDASDPTMIDTASAGPDLTLTKSHAGNFTRNQSGATYSLVVHNIGHASSSGTVTVDDALPSDLTATQMSGPGWTCDVATISCNRSNPLAAGDSFPAITLVVDVSSNASSLVENDAVVSGGGEANTSNDMASDLTTIDSASAGPDLTLTKSHAGNFVRGQTSALYSLVVHNVGDAATNGTVTLSDTLPGVLTVADMDGYGWTCTPATKSCSRSDPLAAGASYPEIRLTVDVAANAPNAVTNSANVSGGGETNTFNDAADDPTTIGALLAPPLVTKSFTPDHVVAGDLVNTSVMTIALTNTDPDTPITGVNFTDNYPTPLHMRNAPNGVIFANTCAGAGTTLTAVADGTSIALVDGVIPANDTCYVQIQIVGTSAGTSDNHTGAVTSDNAGAGADAIGTLVVSDGTVQSQTINFLSAAPANAVVGGPTYLATATATSGLPVALTIDGASLTVCTIDNGGVVRFIGAGTCTIDANQNGNPMYAPAPQMQQLFAVASAGGTTTQTIMFTSTEPVNALVAGLIYFPTATATSQLPVVLTIDGASANVCTMISGNVSFIGAGTCTIDANQGGNGTYAPAPQVQQSFTVAAAAGTSSQLIQFTSAVPVGAVVGGPTYLAMASATSTLPVVLTIDGTSATVCTINDGTVSFIGAGTCTVDANQGGDSNYAPAPQVQQSFLVASAGGAGTQSIHFTSTVPIDAIVGGPSYVATATATSHLPVVLTIDSASANVCTINNATVTFIGAGTCTIDANQGGNTAFAPASQVQQAFTVKSAGGTSSQTIMFTSIAPAGAIVGGPSYLATATANSSLPVVLTIDGVSATVCAINHGIVTSIGEGTCVIDANQGGSAAYAPAPQVQQSFAVASVGGATGQMIQFTSMPPVNPTVAGASYVVTATATSHLLVVLTIDGTSAIVCTINNGTVTFIGEGTCTIDANQGGDATYSPAPQAQQTFAVLGAGGVDQQTIQFTSAPPVSEAVDGPSYLATATATSGLTVVLTIDTASAAVCRINNGTVTFLGAGTCTIDANQGGDATYAPAPQGQQAFPVAAAGTPTVLCQLPKQVDIVGDAVNIDLSFLFVPPPSDTLSYAGTNLPPSLSIAGSLLSGTLQAGDVQALPYMSTLTATTVSGNVSAAEDVVFQVLPTGEVLWRDGFDGGSSPSPCQ